MSEAKNAMNKQHVSLLVLLDLSSAFDTLDHQILLCTFEYDFGINGVAIFLRIISLMYIVTLMILNFIFPFVQTIQLTRHLLFLQWRPAYIKRVNGCSAMV